MLRRYLALVFVLCALAFAFLIFFHPFMFFAGPWRTQTIEFRDRQLPCHRIEFQMQDVGALGYNQRTVEVTPVLGIFEITEEVDSACYASTDWIPVNEDVNELGIKFP